MNNNINIIIVNGIKMTESEYKAMKRNAMPHKPHRAMPKVYNETKERVNTIFKSFRVLDNIMAFHNNAYRMWGNKPKQVLEENHVYSDFFKVIMNIRKVNNAYNKIAMSNNTRQNFTNDLETLSWAIEDLIGTMRKLMDTVNKKMIIERYGNEEWINGEGKRLGLAILLSRAFFTLSKMEFAIRTLQRIA